MSKLPALLFLVGLGTLGCGSDGGDPVDAALTRDGGGGGDGALAGDGGGGGGDGSASVDGGQTGDGATASGLPTADGPLTVTTSNGTVTRGTRSIPFVAYLPAGTARHPLVLLLPGFQIPSSSYDLLAKRVATHGFVVVRADPPASLFDSDHLAMTDDAKAVIDHALGAAPFAGRIDAAKVGAMGHSLGGKLSTMLARRDGRVKALLGIDPVNGGGGPGGGYTAARPDIVPDDVSPLTIPLGFAGETTNQSGGMPCAPADQNYQTFYAAATSATWAAEWTFTGADHMDFLDTTQGCTVCGFCPDGPADDAAVRAGIRTLAAAFFRRHLLADATMDGWLTGATLPAGVTVAKKP